MNSKKIVILAASKPACPGMLERGSIKQPYIKL
jgi:hypothetical protein